MDASIALFLSAFAGLFSVLNPLGAMPVFLSLTATETAPQRRQTALKASIYMVIILLIAFFVGSYILSFFGISIDAMRIAGGLIIISSGFALLLGEHAKNRAIDKKVKHEAIGKEDITLTPLAIPLLSGPGSISLLIGYFSRAVSWTDYLVIVGVVIACGVVTYIILLVSPKFVSRLGASGLNSLTRVMGFIVLSIGIQFIINGVSAVLRDLGIAS
ncbi:MarC family NAAT transporter [soil metagenome]